MGRGARRVPREAESDAEATPSFRYWPSTGGNITYFKTALWLHTLERSLGWPTLQRAMSSYFERWKFRHPQPADFFQAISDAAGRDITPFFDQVYRGSNAYDYGVQQLTSAPAGAGRFRTTVVARRFGEATFPVDVVTTFGDGSKKTERWDGVERRAMYVYDTKVTRAIGGGRSEPYSAARRELHEQQPDAAAAGRGSEPQVEPQVDGVAAGHPAHVRVALLMVFQSWLDGIKRVIAAPAIIASVFVITLVAALPLACRCVGVGMNEHLGASLMADEAADGVNYDWWPGIRVAGKLLGLNSTFTPSIIGFATTLDSVSGLLDRRRYRRCDRDRRRRCTCLRGSSCRAAFSIALHAGAGRVRMVSSQPRACSSSASSGSPSSPVIVYWFLFVYVHEWLFAKWYVGATRDLPFERTVFYWRLLMYAIFAALLALTTTVFDYAKVRAVVEDRRSMIGALVAGAALHHPQPGAGRRPVRGKRHRLSRGRRHVGSRRARCGRIRRVDVGGDRRVAVLHPRAAHREAAVPRVGDCVLPALACALGICGGSGGHQARASGR